MRMPALAIPVMAALVLCVRAHAQPGPNDAGWSDQEKRQIGQLLGELTFRTLSVDFNETPARESIDALRKQLRVPIVGRYSDDPFGHGIDPLTPITLKLTDAPAIDVLTDILSQCSAHDPCTWQIRKGYIEVGTKVRLSVPGARVKRMHYIADLIIDVPNSEIVRKRRELLALDIVQDIVENIEPGSWDYGQIDYSTWEEGDGLRDSLLGEPTAPNRFIEADPDTRRHIRPRKIANIRYWRDWVIVEAPDYIHRQINGYPDPIVPEDLRPAAETASETD